VRIDIEVARNGTSALKHPYATSGLEAKFSGHYCAAAAWVDGCVALSSFTQAAVMRPALREQMQAVALRERECDGESLDTAPVHLAVHGDGWSDGITVDWAPGSPADPMTRDDLHAKWLDCALHGRLPQAEAPLAVLDAPAGSPAADILLPLRGRLLEAAG
jgi:2-methylcitrate dehydratase PrpD